MASLTEIYNRALQHCGVQAITNIDENSRNARAIKRAADPVRKALLEEHSWSFSILQASLAAATPVPTWGRANTFPLPDKFIKLEPTYAELQFGDEDFEIENGSIATNYDSPLNIRFVSDVEDPNKMTPLFREAYACALASAVCEELTQSNSKLANIETKLENIIRKAKLSNAIQRKPAKSPDDTWVSCRA